MSVPEIVSAIARIVIAVVAVVGEVRVRQRDNVDRDDRPPGRMFT